MLVSHASGQGQTPAAGRLVFTTAASDFLEELARQLDVPPSRYEEAKRRYESVGAWLNRDESTLKQFDPVVYVQGSFRLGTPIRPVNSNEHYDIDVVCELTIGKHEVSQSELKRRLGHEMKLYAEHYRMQPPEDARRCWTLQYSDGAQFHLDALPAIPDGAAMRLMLDRHQLSSAWADSAIAITDKKHPGYNQIQSHWPHSNPRGFTLWFRSRMKVSFRKRREAMALEAKASVEDVPTYRVKTPLQQSIQLLKHHRDVMFEHDCDDKPISIIITTLAASAYGEQATVAEAIGAILMGMENHIRYVGERVYILNPTDPTENFADKWVEKPQRREKFFNWLNRAKADFARLGALSDRRMLTEAAGRFVGSRMATAAGNTIKPKLTLDVLRPRAIAAFKALHKAAPPWSPMMNGHVSIDKATWTGRGFSRPIRIKSDGQALMKGASLTFVANTDVPAPYDVYWQVVNTGEEAELAGGLRGGFNTGSVTRGAITRQETTRYSGSHTIECFIVKNGYLAARSGAFIVNIQ